ncbi:hypothetical protein [Metabacillus sp. RGM 3146]|uniref:hypothetical protein n=1 Tax=Metabacillus sp. RGM 3146 TaxID=3401092 RepID=UPI003B99E319
MDKNNKNLIIRTSLGAVAGAAIAALITPKTGEVIKSSSSAIKTKGTALGRGTKDTFSSIKQASTDGLQQSAGILKERAGSIAETVKQKLPASITSNSVKKEQNGTSSKENGQDQDQTDQDETQKGSDHSQTQEQSKNQSEDETGSKKNAKGSGTVVSNNDDTTSADKDNR